MGKKALIRLFIILLVIGVIAAIFHFTGRGGGVDTVTNSTDKTNVFGNFPINEVAEVQLVEKGNTVTLKKGKADWVVAERANYPAKDEVIIGILRGIWDMKIVQAPPIGRSQYGRLQLLDPAEASEEEAASILNFKNAEGKELASLWLGKVYEKSENRPNPFGGGMATTAAGRYIKRGDKNSVYLVGQTFEEVKSEVSDWLDETFFKVEGIESIAIKSGTPADDWKLVREDAQADFAFAKPKKGEELDTTKTSSMKGAFGNPTFEDVLVGEDAKKAKVGNVTFTITTFDGFTYTISVGEKNDLNELPLTVKVAGSFNEKREEGEEESDEEKESLDEQFVSNLNGLEEKLAAEKTFEGKIYKVRSFLVDSITKKRSELLKEKEEPKAEGAGADAAPAAKDLPALPPGITLPGLPGASGN